MQQRANCFGFVTTIFHGDRSYAKDMRDIRDSGLLACLITMSLCGIDQRVLEKWRKLHALD